MRKTYTGVTIGFRLKVVNAKILQCMFVVEYLGVV
jgi:hypothetical protein